MRGWRLFLPLLYVLSALADGEDDETRALENENEQLKARLKALQQIHEEVKYSYVVVKGMIVGAEMIYMETMEVPEAKQWCNSNEQCKGFTFGTDLDGEAPEDEVTMTFKGAPPGSEGESEFHVEPDQNWISYVKESSTAFGAPRARTAPARRARARPCAKKLTDLRARASQEPSATRRCSWTLRTTEAGPPSSRRR